MYAGSQGRYIEGKEHIPSFYSAGVSSLRFS